MDLTLVRCPRQCGTLFGKWEQSPSRDKRTDCPNTGINDCEGFVGVWVHLCCPAADQAVVLEVRYCEASAMEDEGEALGIVARGFTDELCSLD